MKKAVSFIIMAVSYGCSAILFADAVENAEQVLGTQNHIRNPIHYFTPSEEAGLKLYNAQIDAIRILGSRQDLKYVKTLIPYLDYPSSASDALMKFPIMNEIAEERIQNARSVWPAFAAILDTPHSQDILSQYALDEKNPLDYRLTVLVVLGRVCKIKSRVHNQKNTPLAWLAGQFTKFIFTEESAVSSLQCIPHEDAPESADQWGKNDNEAKPTPCRRNMMEEYRTEQGT